MNVASSSSSTPLETFPPPSLANANKILRMAQDMEVSGQQQPLHAAATLLEVEMASLLVLGDVAECRHLWRRHRENAALRSALEPWWNVAAAMLSHQFAAVWEGLQGLTAQQPSSSGGAGQPQIPYQTYATEIAQAYRRRLFQALLATTTTTAQTSSGAGETTTPSWPPMYATLLGFSSPQELEAYYVHYRQEQQQEAERAAPYVVAHQSALVAFLEARSMAS